jgi:hypothetical protein
VLLLLDVLSSTRLVPVLIETSEGGCPQEVDPDLVVLKELQLLVVELWVGDRFTRVTLDLEREGQVSLFQSFRRAWG